MKREVFNILNKAGYDKENIEEVLDLVVELLEFNVSDTEANEPHATHSIAKMKVAISQVQNLMELFAIDPNVEYIMEHLDFTEEQVEELIEESGEEAQDLVDYIKADKLQAFDTEEEAFNWVHEEYDREEILAMLYRGNNDYDSENEFYIAGQTVYIQR